MAIMLSVSSTASLQRSRTSTANLTPQTAGADVVAYVGGKSRVAASLTASILPMTTRRTVYIEPFVGGGSMFQRLAPTFEVSIAADAQIDLVLSWQAIAAGWTPPEAVSESEYEVLRHAEPSALRGWVGFQCSYMRKWWGGYGRVPVDRGSLAGESFRSVENQRAAFEGATAIVHADYRKFRDLMGPAVVAYCDPPYLDTTNYAKQVGAFDHDAFWDEMRQWSDMGALVFVSEYIAPLDWWPVWSQERRMNMTKAGSKPLVTEYLFAYAGGI